MMGVRGRRTLVVARTTLVGVMMTTLVCSTPAPTHHARLTILLWMLLVIVLLGGRCPGMVTIVLTIVTTRGSHMLRWVAWRLHVSCTPTYNHNHAKLTTCLISTPYHKHQIFKFYIAHLKVVLKSILVSMIAKIIKYFIVMTWLNCQGKERVLKTRYLVNVLDYRSRIFIGGVNLASVQRV